MASGLPDFYGASRPGRSTLMDGQTRWEVNGYAILAAGGSDGADFYTVPADNRLDIGFFKVTSAVPGNQLYVLTRDSATVYASYFDTMSVDVPNQQASYSWAEGEAIGLNLYNNAIKATTLYFTLIGVLHEL